MSTPIMNRYIKLPYLVALLGAVLSGCAGPALRPESEIAAIGSTFQKSTKDFTDARKRIAQNRQRTLNKVEEQALQTREEVESALAIWRVVGNKERIRLYEELIAASRAARERADALAAAREAQARALAEANTKVALDQEKLTKAFKLLASLGEGMSAADSARFFLSFAKETQAELEKAAEETQQSAMQEEPKLPGSNKLLQAGK